jgi:cellulose synthase/poly-beta-1,6-N-acetylglucosamine synthase-like glycosyltransferase
MVQLGYKIVHIDEAIVTNKGPETVGDLIRQRRRIFNGHARLSRDENVRISNMTRSSLSLLLFKYQIKSIKHFLWLIGGIVIEIVSRFLGAYDTHVLKLNPFRWDTATTTKHVIQGRAEAHDFIS